MSKTRFLLLKTTELRHKHSLFLLLFVFVFIITIVSSRWFVGVAPLGFAFGTFLSCSDDVRQVERDLQRVVRQTELFPFASNNEGRVRASRGGESLEWGSFEQQLSLLARKFEKGLSVLLLSIPLVMTIFILLSWPTIHNLFYCCLHLWLLLSFGFIHLLFPLLFFLVFFAFAFWDFVNRTVINILFAGLKNHSSVVVRFTLFELDVVAKKIVKELFLLQLVKLREVNLLHNGNNNY